MKILIVGCAKTGTTLLQRLFFAFKGVRVVTGETSLYKVVKFTTGGFPYVFKRTAFTIFSNELPPNEIKSQVEMAKDAGVRLILMERNKSDVLKSTNGWVTEKRYNACVRQKEKCLSAIDYIVSYERLVAEPDVVQKEVEKKYQFTSEAKWSEYPLFVPQKEFDRLPGLEYRARKIGAPK